MRSSRRNMEYLKLKHGLYIIKTYSFSVKRLNSDSDSDSDSDSRTVSGTLKVAHGGNLKSALKSVPLNRCFRRRYFLSTRPPPFNYTLKPGARTKLEKVFEIPLPLSVLALQHVHQAYFNWWFRCSQNKLHRHNVVAFFLSYKTVMQLYLMLTIVKWNARNKH